jgi:predicted ATPase
MRIERLYVKNYRALRELELADLTPMTVLLGPNGSGKSTVFDVFSFLSECIVDDLPRALDRRGQLRELRTRGSTGPIVFELECRQHPAGALATYHLAIDEADGHPFVAAEWVKWQEAGSGKARSHRILSFENGGGWVVQGGRLERDDDKQRFHLGDDDILAVGALGSFRSYPRIAALRRFMTSWYVSHLSAADARAQPEPGVHEHLSKTGDNLANVIQFLEQRHPKVLARILETLRRRIPRLESVHSEETSDRKLSLLLKDAPFADPILARFASDGTLTMLSYLVVLHDPDPPPLIGIEEPENYLHPRLLPELGEECRGATERSQLFVTTHSPFFLDAVQAPEVRILHRDEHGFTRATRASDIRGIPEFLANGATLGKLWLEGHFGVGDPLVRAGAPARARR